MVGSAEVSPERLRAEGNIVRFGDKYRLNLVVKSGLASGTRIIESDSCDHLAGAAAVALGLLVRVARNSDAPLTNEDLGVPTTGQPNPDTDNASQQGHEALSGDDPTGNRTKPANPVHQEIAIGSVSQKPHELEPPEAVASRTGFHASRNSIRLRVRAPLIAVGILNLPGLSLGYGIGLGASYASWQAVLTGLYWPQKTLSSQWPGYGAEVTRYSADLDICRAWRWNNFEWAPCLREGHVHVVARGTGVGIVHRMTSASIFTTGGGITSKLYVAEWAALFLTGSAELQTSRPRLVTQEIGELYRFPAVALKFGLGSEWIF